MAAGSLWYDNWRRAFDLKGGGERHAGYFKELLAMIRLPLSHSVLVFAAFAFAVFSANHTASAQSLFGGGGSTTSRGGTTQGTQYGSSSGTIRSTSPTSGFSSSFGSTSQAGALNSQGLGGSPLNTAGGAAGQTSMTGPQISTELGALSATIGQGGFIGTSDNAGRFIGQQTAGQQSLQGGAMSGLSQLASQFGSRGQDGFNQQSNFNQQSRRTIRPQQRIAFEYPQRGQEAIQTNLSAQFERLQTSRPELQAVEVVLGASNEVILRGQVQSEDDKKLAAMYARMEPGVRSVKNELTVQSN
jgi:osmotically-inducible protein OsmY